VDIVVEGLSSGLCELVNIRLISEFVERFKEKKEKGYG
jgi:hypothetical protein